ncbi:TPA: hypothetical protein N0F65_001601, partial [Lagenidium giganteum]
EWRQYGRQLQSAPPLQAVEGLRSTTLRVDGVWRFKMATAYDQHITVDALLVPECGEELLLDTDFVLDKRTVVDFSTFKVTFIDDTGTVVIPFACTDDDGAVRVGVVRLVERRKITANTRTAVEVAVSATEGSVGIFIPTASDRHLPIVPTVDSSARAAERGRPHAQAQKCAFAGDRL